MIKAILYTLLTLPLLLLGKLLISLLGLIMVPIGLLFSKVEEPPENPNRVVDEPWKYVVLKPQWIQDIWGNDKYGAEGNWFWNDEQDVTAGQLKAALRLAGQAQTTIWMEGYE